MFKTAIVAFMTLFVTVSPIDAAAIFAALTSKNTPSQRRPMVLKGSLNATAILLVFPFSGKKEFLLKLVKDRQRWLYWLLQAKKRYGWIHSGYNEIQRPRQRYGLIDFKNLHIS